MSSLLTHRDGPDLDAQSPPPCRCRGRQPARGALSALVACLIVATSAMAGESPHADAVPVFQCSFGEDWDVNYDGWPDRWIRSTGPEHPHYVTMAIEDAPVAPDQKCLTIGLDGAAAAISSPPIRVMPRFSYVLIAQLKNEHLEHSKVFLKLEFRDSSGRILQTDISHPLSTTSGWSAVQVGPVEPGNPAIDRVVVGLEVKRATRGDLAGRVSLGEVRLMRLPRIAISTNNPSNVYDKLESVVVRCELSGIAERDPEIRFQLLDALGNELQNDRIQLDGRPIVDRSSPGAELTDGAAQAANCYEGSAEWRPRITDYGFYRVAVRMISSEGRENADLAGRELDRRTIYLAVVPPLEMPSRGEFGWTLTSDSPLSFQELSRLLPQVGINWVKVPVWFDATDPQRGDELIRFVELLGASNIEVVGVIDRPPPTTELGARLAENTPIAELLSLESSTWAASLEPVMTRLSLRVRWWQLGRDYDISFVGFPALNKRIEELRTALFRFGQEVRLGMSWDWESLNASSGQVASWDFQQMCRDSPPTEREFEKLLRKPRTNSALRWVFIQPPSRGDDANAWTQAALEARSGELVRRMVAAKVHGADAIIVSHPFDENDGLMHANGMPAELLLPWRTTAAMLGGAEYLGQLQLPAGSENRVFLRPNGQVVMVVWNTEPVEELLYLGDEIRQYDISGRSTTLEQQGREQLICVGPMPTFVLGLHEPITRWRMAVEFENQQVPSIFNTPHPNSLRFHNFFPQGVGGSLRLVVVRDRAVSEHADDETQAGEPSGLIPDRWMIEPPRAAIQLAAGQSSQFPFEIRLKNALFGKQLVRVDFNIEADQAYEFSVYREMDVGTEDLTLEVSTQLEKDGTLTVEQLMTNRAERLADLRCYLYAKGHRRQRMQVYRLGPSVDRKVYRFSDGAELVGKEMLLEVEELNGPRVLKYRFVADAEPDESDESQAAVEQPRDSPLAELGP